MYFIELKIWINNTDTSLNEIVMNQIYQHNEHYLNNPEPNAGFDLVVPEDVYFDKAFESKLVNHNIKCAMYEHKEEDVIPISFCLYPRSSIYKSPLMLANSVGVIDSGYRGFICSALRFLKKDADDYFMLERNTRITQICHPNFRPFKITLVNNEDELGNTTRGAGGFGSTGGTVL